MYKRTVLRILRVLYLHGILTVGDISKLLSCRPGYILNVLSWMYRRGLVEATQSYDKKTVLWKITKKGIDMVHDHVYS